MSDFTGDVIVHVGRGKVETNPLAAFRERVAEVRQAKEAARVSHARSHLAYNVPAQRRSDRNAELINVRTAPEHNLALRVRASANKPRLSASAAERRRAGADRLVVSRQGSYVATYDTRRRWAK